MKLYDQADAAQGDPARGLFKAHETKPDHQFTKTMNSFAGTCHVCMNPVFTRNLFGPISQIAGAKLDVLERNSAGDCLSLLPDHSNIVDVDHRDVVAFNAAPPPPFSTDWVGHIERMVENALSRKH